MAEPPRDLDEPDHYESAVFGCFSLFISIPAGVALIVGGLIWWVTSWH